MPAIDTPSGSGTVLRTVRRGTTRVPGMYPGAPRRNVVVALTYLIATLALAGLGLGLVGS